MLARTAASVVGLGLFLSSAGAFAQDTPSSGRWLPSFGRGPEPSSAPKTLYFSKDPAPPLPVPPAPTLDNATPTDGPASPAPALVPAPTVSSVVPATPVPTTTSAVIPASPAPAVVPVPTTPNVAPPRLMPAVQRPVPQPHTPSHDIQRTAMQVRPEPEAGKGMVGKAPGETGGGGYEPQLEAPGPHRLFRLESERSLFERMRQEALTQDQRRIEFPPEPDVGRGHPWEGRHYAQMAEVVEPCYQCYGRLYFEDLNSERYGWDLGWIQPFVSTAIFAKDVVMLPYHMATDPCRCYECNTGYCLPGDPVPYAIYPPGLSVTGLAAEGAAWVLVAAMFP
jgi:hypothetical protein